MSSKSTSFGKGDWIVHAYYGVGQIKSIETKQIDEDSAKYYKVEAQNSTYFVPVNNVDKVRIRPVASQYMLRKVKKILKESPQELPQDHNERKRHISERLADCSSDNTAKLVRDLFARKIKKGLNDHEEKTFEKLATRLVTEWSITRGIELEKAATHFEEVLECNAAKLGEYPPKPKA